MKLYGDFQKKDWLKVLGIPEKNIPSSFIIHGEWGFEDNLHLWREILCEELLVPKWNTLVGNIKT
jgi:hypothetical protein